MGKIDEIAEIFEGFCHSLRAKGNGSQRLARCPAHEDTNPSLSITSRDGKILYYCFAGCSQEAVRNALIDAGHLPHNRRSMIGKSPNLPPGVPIAWPTTRMLEKLGLKPTPENQKLYYNHHPYHDKKGKIIGHVVRYQGHGKKDLIPFFRKWESAYSPDRWAWRSGYEKPINRTLYNLNLLFEFPALPVLVVEGEKCADAFNARFGSEMIAVTWPGGCKSVKKADWLFLSGRDVYLWADADSGGAKAMCNLFEILSNLETRPISIKAVDFSALNLQRFGQGADVADLLADDPDFSLIPLFESSISSTAKCFLTFLNTAFPLIQQTENKETLDTNADSNDEPFFIPLTDDGNAKRFIEKFGTDLRFTKEAGWFFWQNERWNQDGIDFALRCARETATRIVKESFNVSDEETIKAIRKWCLASQNVTRLMATVRIARSYQDITVPLSLFDSDPWLLNCANGVLDLRDGSLRPACRSDYLTRLIPVAYNEQAECPLWLKFLATVTQNQLAMIDYLRRAIGYSLTGICSEQVMFLLWGNGSNGKSVFLEVLKSLLGEYGLTSPTDLILLNKFGDPATGNNFIARLKGARLVICSEIAAGARLNESRVKEMTGEDTISGRFLYQEAFDFIPQFKLWIRSNYRPEISGNDKGIWRRIHAIPFVTEIAEKDKDKNLTQKLRAELPGIFAWAVSGCLDWQRDGLHLPEEISQTVNVYRRDMDSIGEFLDDCCELKDSSEVSASSLYASYKIWCANMGERPMSQRGLGLNLRERKFWRVKRRDGRYYRGLLLKATIEENSELPRSWTNGYDD